MALSSWAFMPRGSALRSNALAFCILLLTKKGPPSYYLLLTNDRPVHMTIVELCIPCNCNKCTFFFNLNKSQNLNVSQTFTAIKCTCWPFWAF